MNPHSASNDYYIEVTVSNDKLEAFLDFSNCGEDMVCTVQQLEALLKNHSISYGIDYARIVQIATDIGPYLKRKIVIASGDPPQPGKDGIISYLFDLKDQAKKPAVLEDGSVDFREVTTIHNVRKGELLARRIPPTEGIPGKAVTGEVIRARNGKEARFKIGKNVVTDKENQQLYSAIDGVISHTGHGQINVFPVYEVNGDVDYGIGNIDFIGTVVIRGNVLTGFKVKAEGDIRVTGSVEGAEMEAGGSILISAGILGQNKGLIRAGKTVRSAFVQEGNVEAGEDVIISQSIMHSNVRAGRSVQCAGAKGLIVGGKIQAGEYVSARTIGNSLSTATVIEVGVLPEVRSELLQLKEQLKSSTDNLQKTEKALTLLDQLAASGQMSPDKVAMRVKLSNTKKQTSEEIEMSKDRILHLEKTLEDTELAKIEATSTVYGGVRLVMGRYIKSTKDPVQRVYFRIDNGDIVMYPLFP
ncbi:DUF342 domain-containing protein [Paenibacillus sp. J2TS4]|uniref:DUF342 domain-containing protein n=1 Tax=Paenibacillus sp. J2TS4 TaxID=2807194 RepID=UPI001B154DBC|nr:FapA family protein [Paenibacillus sp. J2TS4]GIP33094.1 polymerase [Paenibacillus sp. J2TS4]